MCAFCITGAIDATADSNVLFGGETVFAYNTATYGGTSVKRSGLTVSPVTQNTVTRVRRFG